jgi:hypothetical protein
MSEQHTHGQHGQHGNGPVPGTPATTPVPDAHKLAENGNAAKLAEEAQQEVKKIADSKNQEVIDKLLNAPQPLAVMKEYNITFRKDCHSRNQAGQLQDTHSDPDFRWSC